MSAEFDLPPGYLLATRDHHDVTRREAYYAEIDTREGKAQDVIDDCWEHYQTIFEKGYKAGLNASKHGDEVRHLQAQIDRLKEAIADYSVNYTRKRRSHDPAT
jgi:hypothetical protein